MNDRLLSSFKSSVIGVFPWLITALAIVAVVVLMTPRTPVIVLDDEVWSNSPADDVSEAPHLPEAPLAQDWSAEGPGDQPAPGGGQPPPLNPDATRSLDAPVESTDDAAVRNPAAERDSDVLPQQETPPDKPVRSESLPRPAAHSAKVGASNRQDSAQPVTAAGTTNTPASLSAERRPPETAAKRGRWVINLASSGSEETAERYRSTAVSRGVDAELSSVTVKGKDYWRVQVPGFATAAEAKGAAASIKEMLGLDDVWIFKR
jgi:cell division septation protein DedD